MSVLKKGKEQGSPNTKKELKKGERGEESRGKGEDGDYGGMVGRGTQRGFGGVEGGGAETTK